MKRKEKKPTVPTKGRLPENKSTQTGFVKSEAQRFVKSGSTGASSKEMDAYASKRLSQIAKNRRQAAR